MQRFEEGNRVRVDILDTTDPDHDRYHGREGVVKNVVSDAASDVTGTNGMLHTTACSSTTVK
mgnify:CR=1 FL=1